MAETNWMDVAIKYGGFMEMDRTFLTNFLSGLSTDKKKAYLLPSPQVINASFAELYQKRSPKEASTYFFRVTQHLGAWFPEPMFDMEGKKGWERFRFIRLNINGESHGFCYVNAKEEGRVFSELPKRPTGKFLMNIAQIFPHYVVQEDEGIIRTCPMMFDSFSEPREMSGLTESAENKDFIKYSGYNADDVLARSADSQVLGERYYQFYKTKFTIYQKKA